MTHHKSELTSAKKAFSSAVKSVKTSPALFIPFLIFAAAESASLIFVYLIPRAPFRAVFGPPIKAFWGEAFLHYPTNFLLLPKLASLVRMSLTVVLGSLLTGMAVNAVFNLHEKRHINLTGSLKSAFKKYVELFIIVLVFTLLFYFLGKIILKGLLGYFRFGHSRLLFLPAATWMGPILTVLNFIFAIFLQSAFVYAIPILIIEKQRLLESITKSFSLFKKLFVPTLILAGLPTLIYIPIIILINNNAFLIDKVFPEFVLIVLFLGTMVSSLIIDPVITVSTTLLYLAQKENQA
jgi:hypothetical protein